MYFVGDQLKPFVTIDGSYEISQQSAVYSPFTVVPGKPKNTYLPFDRPPDVTRYVTTGWNPEPVIKTIPLGHPVDRSNVYWSLKEKPDVIPRSVKTTIYGTDIPQGTCDCGLPSTCRLAFTNRLYCEMCSRTINALFESPDNPTPYEIHRYPDCWVICLSDRYITNAKVPPSNYNDKPCYMCG